MTQPDARQALFTSTVLLLCLLVGLLSGCGGDPLEEVRSLQEAGQYQESIEPLEDLLESRPDDPEIQYLYGLALLRTGQGSQALWPLRAASQNEEWAVTAGEALATAALLGSDSVTAIEAATQVLELEPDRGSTLRLRIDAYIDSGQYESALEDIARLEDLEPDSEDVLVMRLLALLGLERVEEADEIFAELQERASDPDRAPLSGDRHCAAYATYAKESDQQDVAEERYAACLKIYPTSSVVIREALKFYDELGRDEDSVQVLVRVLEEEPANPSVREELARRFRALGRPQDAEAALLAGTKLSKSVAYEAWGGLASHHFLEGNYEASLAAVEQALELLDEPGPDELSAYAEALLAAGRYERALEVANQLPPAHADITRGMIHLEQNKPGLALQHFEAGLRLWPNHSVGRYYSAVAAERLGDFDRAISEYRQALRSGAADTPAGLNLALLFEAEGSMDTAWHAIGMYLRDHPGDAQGIFTAVRIHTKNQREGDKLQLDLRDVPPDEVALHAGQASRDLAALHGPKPAVQFLLSEEVGIDYTSPRNWSALSALVDLLVQVDRGEEARERVQQALAAHPDAAHFYAVQGELLETNGAAASEVRQAFARAAELDADCAPALAGLGRQDERAGDAASALAFYDRAGAQNPGDVDSRRRAASLALAAGDLEDASQRLQEILYDRPYDPAVAADLAAVLNQRGASPGRVRTLTRQAVRFGGGQEVYGLLVDSHLAGGEEAQRAATRRLREAAKQRPRDASLLYQLGRLLAATGRHEEARTAFEQALAAGDFPEQSDAATALSALPPQGAGG